MTVVEPRLQQLPNFAVAAHGLALDLVVDEYRRYPGEPVTVFARVSALEPVPGFTLQFELPSDLMPQATAASDGRGDEGADILTLQDGYAVIWRVERDLERGDSFEFWVETTLGSFEADAVVEVHAHVLSELSDDEQVRVSEVTAIHVAAKGRYLQYLPMIYEEDDVMGRFLMLFESFWAPIERQIDNVSHYFDPKMTTPAMLPFLASWVDLSLDDRWPDERQRQLLLSVAQLHRRRGTRRGMREMLEVYTGGSAIITEHSANNFQLGKRALLGRSIALGRTNRPHTFTARLRLPAIDAPDEAVRAEREREREAAIRELIEKNKPAHASFQLKLETL